MSAPQLRMVKSVAGPVWGLGVEYYVCREWTPVDGDVDWIPLHVVILRFGPWTWRLTWKKREKKR